MSDDKVRVFCYSTDDERTFVYNYNESETQEFASIFTRDIWFFLTDEEYGVFNIGLTPEEQNNLKRDFIWFQPGVNKRHIIQCTCGHFLESGHSMDKLARLGYKHHQRTGHAINLRGN